MQLFEILEEVRKKQPLIQCITNFVTVNDCANIILASGANPSMCMDIREAAEAVSNAKALVCNLGAIEHADSMLSAGKRANELNVPVVLDPVAAGTTELRRNYSAMLLNEVKFAAIRGNASEIKALALSKSSGSGVDVSAEDVVTAQSLESSVATAKLLADKTSSVIVISGAIDIVTDGKISYIVKNGCQTMSRITGSGCMLTSLIGAFCAAKAESPLIASLSAVVSMGICGELAEMRRLKNKTGNATFRTDLIDAVFNLSKNQFEEMARYEIFEK